MKKKHVVAIHVVKAAARKRNVGKFYAVGRVMVILTAKECQSVIDHLEAAQKLYPKDLPKVTQRLIDKFVRAL